MSGDKEGPHHPDEVVEDWHGRAIGGAGEEPEDVRRGSMKAYREARTVVGEGQAGDRAYVVSARAALYRALRDLRFGGAMGQVPLSYEAEEVAYLAAVTVWLIEFNRVLADVATTTEEMSQELRALQAQRTAIRAFLGIGSDIYIHHHEQPGHRFDHPPHDYEETP